jgi:hypothetical protein
LRYETLVLRSILSTSAMVAARDRRKTEEGERVSCGRTHGDGP